MEWFTAFVLYVMIWWVVLFAVLPFGTRPVAEPDDATGWRGAPARPRLLLKLAVTTLLSTLLWGGAMLVVRSDWLSFRTGVLAMHDS